MMKILLFVRKFLSLALCVGLPLLFSGLVAGCATETQPSIPVTLPPPANVGDVSLDLTVKTSNGQFLPKNTRLVVSIDQGSGAIAGDVITLSKANREMRVSIPLDKTAIAPCRKKMGACAVKVRAHYHGKVIFKTLKSTSFQKQKHIKLRLNPAV